MNTTSWFTKLLCIGMFVGLVFFGLTSRRTAHATPAPAAAAQSAHPASAPSAKKQRQRTPELQAKQTPPPPPEPEPSAFERAKNWLLGTQTKPWNSPVTTTNHATTASK